MKFDLTDNPNNVNYKDLKVGIHLPIYGKNIFLYDCDQYTREFSSIK